MEQNHDAALRNSHPKGRRQSVSTLLRVGYGHYATHISHVSTIYQLLILQFALNFLSSACLSYLPYLVWVNMRMNARLYSETKRNSRIQMDEKILLKVREVIEATGLSRSQVYFMIATGELPAIR